MSKIFKRDPYTRIDRQKIRAEKLHREALEKAWRRRQKADNMKELKKRLSKFLTHPFDGKRMTSDELERLRIKKVIRCDLKILWEKWWEKFRENPWRAIFRKGKRSQLIWGIIMCTT